MSVTGSSGVSAIQCIEVYGGVYLGTHIGYRDVGHILWQVYLKILGTELYVFRETCHMNMSNIFMILRYLIIPVM